MNTTIHTTTSHRAGSRVRARRVGTLTVAGALAGLALAPAVAHASQLEGAGGGARPAYVSHDIDDVVAIRKEQMTEDYHGSAPSRAAVASRSAPAAFTIHVAGCDISGTLDEWSRRLIAIQVCGKAYVVTAAAFRAPVRYAEPIPYPQSGAGAVGHCGHQGAHQPLTTGLPVSAWFTPTSC
jgi:hypothetical protein